MLQTGILVATLATSLKSLHDLWIEYDCGIGGRKTAKLFTPSERGKVKFVYSRRNVAWKMIRNLVVIHSIYSIYGHGSSVSSILKKMSQDIKNNSLSPLLRISFHIHSS